MNNNDVNVKKIFDSAIKNHKNNNFGIAEKLYKQILEINPLHFDSIFYLASLSAQIKNLSKARELFEKAIQIRPNYVSSYNNLGGVFLELGKYFEALVSFQKAIMIDPNHVNARNNLAVLLRSAQLRKIEGTNLKELFLFLFKRNDIEHGEIFRNAKLTLFSEKKYIKLTDEVNLDSSLLKKSTIQNLMKDELFLLMLQKSLIADYFLEKILTKLRCEILFNLRDSQKNILEENFDFITSLSNQCFFNEYVFTQTKKEINYLNKLKKKIEKSKKIDEIDIIVFGSYTPLHSNKKITKKLSKYKSDKILFDDLITVQIKEPLTEKRIQNSIRSLGKISNIVSKKVRDQYEKNPYPRWKYTYAKLPSHFLLKLNNQIRPNKIKIENKFNNPNVLIAGCGTGHHICVVKDYLNANILGVDLSLSSLAYAKRKTEELGFDNIEYLNADILELNKLTRKFDIIECIGVLHHMKEPQKGLKILLDLLEPHGLLKIGLYSEKARNHIGEVRKFIKKNKFKNTIEDIRKCREKIFNKKKDKMFEKIINRRDFYSTSSVRDLMFHAQEHCFNLPQLSKIILDFDLEFLGFTNEMIKNKYSKLFPEDRENILLENWNNFEISAPDAFISMYNFWVRKKIN